MLGCIQRSLLKLDTYFLHDSINYPRTDDTIGHHITYAFCLTPAKRVKHLANILNDSVLRKMTRKVINTF